MFRLNFVMRHMRSVLLICLFGGLAHAQNSQPVATLTPGIISTYAGNGDAFNSGDGGPATSASIGGLVNVAIDKQNNLYLVINSDAVAGDAYVRKVDPQTGVITTIAGSGAPDISGDGGPAIHAGLGAISAMTADASGNLYLTSYDAVTQANEIRKIDHVTGIISKIAGNETVTYSGDNGPATDAGIDGASCLALDASGNLYLCGNGRIRKIDASTGIITTVAGNGTFGSIGDGGPATDAQMLPYALAISPSGDIYVSDIGNGSYNFIRKIDHSTGTISLVAGSGTGDTLHPGATGDGGPATSANITQARGLNLDPAGNLYFIDIQNGVARKIDTKGIISTIAGRCNVNNEFHYCQATFSGDGGIATQAYLDPFDLVLDSAGNLYIGENYHNNRVRRVNVSLSSLSWPTPTQAGYIDSEDGSQSVTLANAGNAPLTFTAPQSGTNPSATTTDFTLAPTNTCPVVHAGDPVSTLAPGDSCTLAIDFTPVESGTLTANFVVANDSEGVATSQQVIQLSGQATSSTADATTIQVATISSNGVIGNPITLTATVADTKDPTKVPTGTVIFTVTPTSSSGAPTTSSPATVVANGVASFSFTPKYSGTFAVTAIFSPGDPTTYRGSSYTTGQPMTVVGDFSLLGGTGDFDPLVASKTGPPAVFIVNLTPGTGGFPSDVKLSVSGLPSEAVVSISPASVPQNGGAVTATITINISGVNLSEQHSPPVPFGKSPVVVAGLALVCGFTWRRRRLGVPFLLTLLLAVATTLTGCVQRTNASLSSYSVVVTAASGSVQHTFTQQFSISR